MLNKKVAGSLGRRCAVCRKAGDRSAMQSRFRHLHELDTGARFKFAGGGPTHELEQKRVGRCVIRQLQAVRERVEINPEGKDPVVFFRTIGQSVSCSPTAEVRV